MRVSQWQRGRELTTAASAPASTATTDALIGLNESQRQLRAAYIVGLYPAVSHTFIQREVAALRRRGAEVVTLSIHRAGAGDVLSAADRRNGTSLKRNATGVEAKRSTRISKHWPGEASGGTLEGQPGQQKTC